MHNDQIPGGQRRKKNIQNKSVSYWFGYRKKINVKK